MARTSIIVFLKVWVLWSCLLSTDGLLISPTARPVQKTKHSNVNFAIKSSLPVLRKESRLRSSEDNGQWDDEEEDVPKKKRGGGPLAQFRRWLRSEEGKEDVRIYFSSLALALLLRLTIIEPRYIPSLSMYPTFEVGDQLAVEKVTKRIKPFYRREVVVFNPPQTFREVLVNQYGQDGSRSREALIKRIVAVEVSEKVLNKWNKYRYIYFW